MILCFQSCNNGDKFPGCDPGRAPTSGEYAIYPTELANLQSFSV